MNENESTPEPNRVSRRWHELHRSTWVVLAVTMAVLIAANLPYQFDGPTVPFRLRFLNQRATKQYVDNQSLLQAIWNLSNNNYQHAGWPCHYYVTVPSGEINWDVTAMLIDLFVTEAIIVTVGFVFEWRRRRRRSWLHISIADLMVAVIVLTPALAWHRACVVRHERTRALLIQPAANSSIQVNRTQIISLPSWISRYLPETVFEPLASITRLEIRRPSANLLRQLDEFQELRSLVLSGADLRSADLSSLRFLTHLEEFVADGCPINDEQLEALETLPALRFVSLANTSVSDRAILHLAKIRNIEGVDLRRTRVSAEQVRWLESVCPHLRIVDL